jgi:carbon storage regulator CsrA
VTKGGTTFAMIDQREAYERPAADASQTTPSFPTSKIMDEEIRMLVLSRKPGQELVIGDNVRITVNRVSGNRVTLGISAPDEVRIVRGELDPIVTSFEEEVSEPVDDSPADQTILAPWIGTESLPPMTTRQLH